mmetsp:Transcript_108/g.85  ORF Transcript_108/g.85 Transcript_108/m.85 type:complete len:151 (+) Transcript_108:242-694(+)
MWSNMDSLELQFTASDNNKNNQNDNGSDYLASLLDYDEFDRASSLTQTQPVIGGQIADRYRERRSYGYDDNRDRDRDRNRNRNRNDDYRNNRYDDDMDDIGDRNNRKRRLDQDHYNYRNQGTSPKRSRYTNPLKKRPKRPFNEDFDSSGF